MPTVRFAGKSVDCPSGTNLYRLLAENGFPLDAPCGGRGTCGKCRVQTAEFGTVRSCDFAVETDLTIEDTDTSAFVETAGTLRDVPVDFDDPFFAADIGTTTLVVYLVVGGKITDFESALNPQKTFGADVISRITFCMDRADGVEMLRNAVGNEIERMKAKLNRRNGTNAVRTVVAGNTVMLHLYAGVSPVSIGTAPFTPVFTERREIGSATLLPSISGYVGADTVAAVLASGMHLSDSLCLLADIGTNGEIVLGNRHGLLACATAAGPAFEGAQIECGAGGVPGAINRVTVQDGKVRFTTLDNRPPSGICGSGILDLCAEMLRTGLVDETGLFEDEVLHLTETVYFTQKDIRQIQLAKAAVSAGIHTLLRIRGVTPADVDRCYLAGGFGTKLNRVSALRVGLLPKIPPERIVPLGNAAGMGAVLWGASSRCREETEQIVRSMRYVELSENAVFNREFPLRMTFDS